METPERRASKRLLVTLPATYATLGDQKHFGETVTKDISISGLRMNCDAFLAANTPCTIRLRFPEVNKIIEAMARIVWSHRVSFSDNYQAGLEFYEISPISKRWLEEYILIHESMDGE